MWRRPHSFRCVFEKYTESADVYAFGMLMYEVTHKALPFAECKSGISALLSAQEQNRPRLAVDLSSPLASLMDSCWQHMQIRRPTIHEVTLLLQRLLQAHTDTEPTDVC